MMINQSYLIFGLLAGNALFLVIVIAALLRVAARITRLEATVLGLGETTAAADVVNAQFQRQEKVLRWLAGRTQAMDGQFRAMQEKDKERRARVDRQAPIEHAVRMARQGASIDDLTRNFGLNIGEARLMQKLHGQEFASTATN